MRVPIASNRAFISPRRLSIFVSSPSMRPSNPSMRPASRPSIPEMLAVTVRMMRFVDSVSPPSIMVAKMPMSTQLCGSVTTVTVPVCGIAIQDATGPPSRGRMAPYVTDVAAREPPGEEKCGSTPR
jgi:hypothetical protein